MKQYFTLIALLIFSFPVFSQDPSSPSIRTNKPFNPDETVERGNVYHEQYCLKWHTFMMGRGIFNMTLEKMLNDKLSIEFGGGVAYRDWYFEDNNKLQLDGIAGEEEIDVKLGPVINLSLRYYFYDGELEGFYIAPILRYRAYNIKSLPTDPTVTQEDVGYKMTDYGFLIGTQMLEVFGDLSIDLYTGAGMSQRSYHKQEEYYTPFRYTTHTKQVPYVFFGLNIGLPF